MRDILRDLNCSWDHDRASHARHAQQALGLWIRSNTFADLARLWSESPPSGLSDMELFDWYDAISSRHWDFRKGAERNLVESARLTDMQSFQAIDVARELGLMSSYPPSQQRYDHVVILGGLIRACVTRPRYAFELLEAGLVCGDVIALGGLRPLTDDEIAIRDKLRISGRTEFDVMIEGMKRAFGIMQNPHIVGSFSNPLTNSDWGVATFTESTVTVLAAPSTDPKGRRANTFDTLQWWADRTPNLIGSSILLITSPIYRLYQGGVAIEALAVPYGCRVETVGVSKRSSDLGSLSQTFGPTQYLQEIRSSIRGLRSLYQYLTHIA